MSKPLYTTWFVASKNGSSSTPVSFWDDTHADHTTVYVVRSVVLTLGTGTGKAWIQAHGPVPPYPPTGVVLAQINNLFTTPTAGPTDSKVNQLTVPLPRGSRLELHTSGPLVQCIVSGWRLKYATATTAPTRY